ncbi:hypothetical protein C0J52_18993 [Blattella germanica]|nr:hypothetical protein C0J52_18993 [Blattella germanica]
MNIIDESNLEKQTFYYKSVLGLKAMLSQVINCRLGASGWQLLKYETRSIVLKRSSSATAEAAQSFSEEWAKARPYEDLPGELSADIVEIQNTMYNKFGDICRLDKVPGRNNMVFVFKPEDIETVYRNEGQQPVRPSFESLGHYRTDTRKELYDGIGGAIVAQGQEWQDFRSKMNPIMMQPRAIKPYVGPIDAVAADFIKSNRIHCTGHPNGVPRKRTGTKLRATTNDKCCSRTVLNIINSRSETKVCMKYINQAAERLKNTPTDSDRELTVLEKLLARDSNPKTAMVMALDMFFAGIETTAYSTANVLYYLAKHQDKQQILFEELSKLIPDKTQPITPEIMNELKYLKACTKESMRLSPIVSGNLRTTTKDIVLSGYRIPKDIDVILPHNKLSLMDEYFPEAKKYIPERWLKGSGLDSAAGTHPFVYMPFGFGPRMCLGRRFAELEMETMLAKIIRNFQVEYNYALTASVSNMNVQIARVSRILGSGIQQDVLRNIGSVVVRRRNSTAVAASQVSPESWEHAKPYDEIPGPKPIAIIGNLWRFIPGIGDTSGMNMKDFLKYMEEKYGDISRLTGIPGREDVVFVYNPMQIEKVFRNEGPWPIRDSVKCFVYYRNITRKDVFQGVGGLVTVQGEEWQKFRSKVNPTLMQPRYTKQYVGPIDTVAEDFIKRIRDLRDENQEMPANFNNEMYKWTIAYIALDTRLGCLDGDLKPDSEPQKMIDAVQVQFDTMFKMELGMPFWKFFSTRAWRDFVKASDYSFEVSRKYVTQAMDRMKARAPDDERELTVLEKLLLRDPDPRTAMVMAVDMLGAGIDTTSYATVNVMYYLAKNQDKQQKLFEELRRFLPGKEDPLTSNILNEMKYLKACIKESMRISPITSGNQRVLVKDLTSIVMPFSILNLMDKHFPEAKKFIPERWTKENPFPDKKPHGFVSLPFGFGPRMCIGRRFAELEIETLLAKIIRNFKVEYNYGEMEFASRLLYTPVSPLKFKMIYLKSPEFPAEETWLFCVILMGLKRNVTRKELFHSQGSISYIVLDTRLGCLDSNLKPDSEAQKMIDSIKLQFDCMYELDTNIPLWKFISTPSWRTFTAFSAMNALYYLSKNQEKQQKLYEEIRSLLPQKEDPITADKLNEMKYLKACMKETLRYTSILMPLNILSNNEKYYPEANKYIPERWIEDGFKFGKKPHPFTYLPFGYGPRMFIGRRFSEMEVQTLIAKSSRNMYRLLLVVFISSELRDLIDVNFHEALHKKYGNILRISGIPGKNDFVFTYNPDDIEKVFRNEGSWPIRPTLQSAEYYRVVTRKDVFGKDPGLTISQGEQWQKSRTKVNQTMMQPRSTKLYISPINAVADDFIESYSVHCSGHTSRKPRKGTAARF